MLRIIGFEGYSGQAPVNFGCAAISDGESVWNSATKSRCTIAKWQTYVTDQAVTVVEPYGPLPGAVMSLSCMVLRAPLGPVADLLVDNSQPGEFLETWAGENHHYWLFPSLEALKTVSMRVAPAVLKLAEGAPDPEARKSIEAQAYVLDRELSPTVQRIRAMARERQPM